MSVCCVYESVCVCVCNWVCMHVCVPDACNACGAQKRTLQDIGVL